MLFQDHIEYMYLKVFGPVVAGGGPWIRNQLSIIPIIINFRVLLEEFNIESGEGQIQWYSQILKGLENSFPKLFDAVVSSALSDEESKAGVAVKTILGINTSRNDLFLKLVHPNEDIRVQAIKHIRKHFEPDQVFYLIEFYLNECCFLCGCVWFSLLVDSWTHLV